jgi:hypothetical protein
MKPHGEFGHETNKEYAHDGDGNEHEQSELSEYEEEEVEEEGEEELEGNENVHEPPSKKKGVLLFASRQLQEVDLGVKNWDHHQRGEPALRSPLMKWFLLQRLLELHMLEIEPAKEKISLLIDCL